MYTITLKENEKLLLPILWTGEETELSYSISLAGRGAGITFLALLLGKASHTLKLKTHIYHQAPDTTSNILVKSTLQDTSQIHFDGLIKIAHGAKRTNAWLAAHMLLLSNKAKGSAIPNLEIQENDIKAGHAATVGKISDVEIFYLMSRGFTEKQAKILIMEGFLESIITKFPQKLISKSRKKLEGLELASNL